MKWLSKRRQESDTTREHERINKRLDAHEKEAVELEKRVAALEAEVGVYIRPRNHLKGA